MSDSDENYNTSNSSLTEDEEEGPTEVAITELRDEIINNFWSYFIQFNRKTGKTIRRTLDSSSFYSKGTFNKLICLSISKWANNHCIPITKNKYKPDFDEPEWMEAQRYRRRDSGSDEGEPDTVIANVILSEPGSSVVFWKGAERDITSYILFNPKSNFISMGVSVFEHIVDDIVDSSFKLPVLVKHGIKHTVNFTACSKPLLPFTITKHERSTILSTNWEQPSWVTGHSCTATTTSTESVKKETKLKVERQSTSDSKTQKRAISPKLNTQHASLKVPRSISSTTRVQQESGTPASHDLKTFKQEIIDTLISHFESIITTKTNEISQHITAHITRINNEHTQTLTELRTERETNSTILQAITTQQVKDATALEQLQAKVLDNHIHILHLQTKQAEQEKKEMRRPSHSLSPPINSSCSCSGVSVEEDVEFESLSLNRTEQASDTFMFPSPVLLTHGCQEQGQDITPPLRFPLERRRVCKHSRGHMGYLN